MSRMCVFQLLNKADGNRTDVICMERNKFADLLKGEKCADYRNDNVYVLVLAEVDKEGDRLCVDFSNAPVVFIETFISQYGSK